VKHGDPNVYDETDTEPKNPHWPRWFNKPNISSERDPNKTYISYVSLKPNKIRVTTRWLFLKCDFWRAYSNYPYHYEARSSSASSIHRFNFIRNLNSLLRLLTSLSF
jgi:hypothetical protein